MYLSKINSYFLPTDPRPGVSVIVENKNFSGELQISVIQRQVGLINFLTSQMKGINLYFKKLNEIYTCTPTAKFFPDG